MRPGVRALGTIAVALALAGCVNVPPEPEPARVQFEEREGFGEILTDRAGRTLYVFDNDGRGQSNCYDACAGNWPPFLTEAAPEGPEDIQDRLGTTTREDGNTQVTIDRRPLYHYIGDTQVGDVNGHGVVDAWWTVPRDNATADGATGDGGNGTADDETDGGPPRDGGSLGDGPYAGSARLLGPIA